MTHSSLNSAMDASMFNVDKKQTRATVSVVLDGHTVSLPTGMSVAAGLLGIGEIISRISPSSHKPCAPHCLMGVCHECLMEINGVQRQACMTEPAEGMVIKRRLDEKMEENHEPTP